MGSPCGSAWHVGRFRRLICKKKRDDQLHSNVRFFATFVAKCPGGLAFSRLLGIEQDSALCAAARFVRRRGAAWHTVVRAHRHP